MIGLGLGSNTNEKKNPLAFSFTNVSGVNPSTVQSSSCTPAGFDGSVVANVTAGSGSIRKNGTGSFVTSLILFPNDVLDIQATSSSSWGTAVNTTVQIGTVSTTWSVTTTAVTPGSNTFSTPGTHNFIAPPYNNMTVTVLAGGGGSGGCEGWTVSSGGKSGGQICNGPNQGDTGGTGGSSSFDSGLMSATGGSGGISEGGGGGAGVGSGGNVTNDSNGASGGIAPSCGNDTIGSPSCGSNGFAGAGGHGGRAISNFTYPSFNIVGVSVSLVVGGGGAGGGSGGGSGPAGNAGGTGSVTISWS